MSKIVQIAATSHPATPSPFLVALTDDGRIFIREGASDDVVWRELSLPQELQRGRSNISQTPP